MERLQKVIANSGYTSRRKAEELILQGKVKVNNKVINTLGTKVSSSDIISIDGKKIDFQNPKVYYLLYKPRKTICSVHDDLGRTTVVDLINNQDRIYPIGRLDYDTTGLILLTNDGELANLLMHPKNNVEKTYIAKIEGLLTSEEIFKIKKGLSVDNRKVNVTHFKVRKKDKEKQNMLVEITIVEGRNHIVKRLFDLLNHPVIKLSRISYDFLTLDGLKPGEYRALSLKEVKKLYRNK